MTAADDVYVYMPPGEAEPDGAHGHGAQDGHRGVRRVLPQDATTGAHTTHGVIEACIIRV